MSDYKAEIDLNFGTAKGSSKTKKDSSGAFAGGLIGALLGNLLSSVKKLFDPLTAIAGLLVMALFPLFKPFLILFIKVGILLYNWLQDQIKGAGESGLQSGIFAGLIVGITALIAGFTAMTAGVMAVVSSLSFLVGWNLGDKLAGAFQPILDMFANFLNIADNLLGTKFVQLFFGLFSSLDRVLGGFESIISGLLSFDFSEVWQGLKDIFFGSFEVLKNMLLITWEGLKAVFIVAWEGLKAILSGSWSALTNFGAWIYDGLTNLLTISFQALKGIGQWISNKIKSMVSFFFGGGSSKSVNDAIITPNGDIIRTNPNDYLIATKTPGDFGGGNGGSKNITVNINGGMITEEVARDIGRILQREINMSGGF